MYLICICLFLFSLSLCRQEKEAAVRCCGEDMAALTFQAQRREHELTQKLQQMEAQHERSGGCPPARRPLPEQPLHPPFCPRAPVVSHAVRDGIRNTCNLWLAEGSRCSPLRRFGATY